jgi:steroid delta-isomerase-like uncharacterized protein
MSTFLSITRAQANRIVAERLVQACFDPVRPAEFDRFTADERARFIFAAFGEAFPDARLRVDSMTADERRVVVGGSMEGTHLGPWRGVAASGRRVDVMVVATLTFEDGRITGISVVTDSLALAEQIGVVEPLAPKACQLYDQAVVSSSQQ